MCTLHLVPSALTHPHGWSAESGHTVGAVIPRSSTEVSRATLRCMRVSVCTFREKTNESSGDGRTLTCFVGHLTRSSTVPSWLAQRSKERVATSHTSKRPPDLGGISLHQMTSTPGKARENEPYEQKTSPAWPCMSQRSSSPVSINCTGERDCVLGPL
ncbi:hypothetical protein EV401DRAFT_46087 [Pisolithus croceorrhizus]|nr:hypothetical protein EV401DRAFT_46087 [Pisolithus croceorrhizus]